jgi:hypothetical protein
MIAMPFKSEEHRLLTDLGFNVCASGDSKVVNIAELGALRITRGSTSVRGWDVTLWDPARSPDERLAYEVVTYRVSLGVAVRSAVQRHLGREWGPEIKG